MFLSLFSTGFLTGIKKKGFGLLLSVLPVLTREILRIEWNAIAYFLFELKYLLKKKNKNIWDVACLAVKIVI